MSLVSKPVGQSISRARDGGARMNRSRFALSPLTAAVVLVLAASGAAAQGAAPAGDAPSATAPASAPQAAGPQTSINERIKAITDDFNKVRPLERGARDARESSVLKGEHGWMQQMLLAMQRNRWDIVGSAGGGRLLLIAIVLAGVALLSRLVGGRRRS
jgi:hypothetical protein